MFIIALIENLLIEELGSYFTGIFGKLRLKCFTKKLKEEIEVSILKQYGDTIYYIDFDRFLIKHDVINKIIKNFRNHNILQSKTINQSVDFYLNLFIEEFPKYKIYINDLKKIIQKYFAIIFKRLNKIDTNESQALCRVIKEISGSLEEQLKNVKRVVDENNSMLKQVINGSFKTINYIEVLLATYCNSYVQSEYFDRQLYQELEDSKKQDSLETLLKNRKIVLVGEAGFGKTLETFRIISKLCKGFSSYQLIPVYIPLVEYEDGLDTLFKIIQTKLEPFCEGNSKEAISQLFINNKLALFFDGIDDINDEKRRAKFFSEANQLMVQYNNNFFFFTTRQNRYSHQFGEDKCFNLTSLDKNIIHRDLIKIGQYRNLPEAYIELFRNPLLYKISKTILTDVDNKELFNRTQIFSEYFVNIYRYKNSYSELTLHDTLNLFGRFSYEYFEKSSFTYSEIDKIISSYLVSTTNKRTAINYFINFGIFEITDKISFSHKLFKEFCAAYYITNNLSILSDTVLLEKLISKEAWREVVIFISGLFSNIEEQDDFLDFVLKQNLPLYVECVNSKNDLLKNNETSAFSLDNHLERILSQIHKTYKFVVENYFYAISEQFEPFLKEEQKLEYKINITGGAKDSNIYYWFDIVDKCSPDIKIVKTNMLSHDSQEYRTNILMKTKQMIQHSINIELSGLEGDSGRKIAIDIIKSNLSSILEKRSLPSSKYILCELLKNIKEKLPWLKDTDEISEMSKRVRKRIDEVLQEHPETVNFITLEGVELFSLNNLLSIVLQSGVDYRSHVIPGRDREYSETNGLTLNLYSTKRKVKIVESFFNFAEASYLEMVKYNFPNIYKYFSKYQDMPYKLLITYTDDEKNPLISYYHVAYTGDKNFVEVSLGDFSKDYEEVFEEILQSFHSLNRVPKHVSLNCMDFSSLLFSRKFRGNTPLSDYVHEEIKKSLEEIFGEI